MTSEEVGAAYHGGKSSGPVRGVPSPTAFDVSVQRAPMFFDRRKACATSPVRPFTLNLELSTLRLTVALMGSSSESPLDRLWKEYSGVFRDFDDHTLARWLCQTLGQLEGRIWRMSHPLVSAYRLAAQVAQDRQIWFKRLATPPMAYPEAGCCRSPLLPLFTRDIAEGGLVCHHCGEACIAFDEIPADIQEEIRAWCGKYAQLHEVAHWEDAKRKQAGNYDARFEDAASKAEQLLWVASTDLMPKLLEHYPAVVWEDQDECLEVRPEDIEV